MTYVLALPEAMSQAAADLERSGSAIGEVNAAAAQRTTGLLAAARDEVSAAVATLFSGYGQEFHALTRRLTALHGDFSQALAAAGGAYQQAEAAAVTAVAPTQTLLPASYTTVFISGSGIPIPSAPYMTAVFANYVLPNFPGGSLSNALALFTPAGLYPLTGTNVLSLNESVAQGVQILDSTLFGTGIGQHGIIQPGGNPVVVQGISQGAIIASLEMQKLATMASPPTAGELGFVLLGDPMNPNGGLLSRFAGLNMPSLGLTFFGATPSDTAWPTHIYTLEYDGIADWPRYPLNILSDLNAFAGLYYVHGLYPSLDPASLPNGYGIVDLPTSPGYTGNSTYSMITIPHLPLLQPVRSIPLVGNLIADLVEPDMRVLVNLGYGDVAHGYSTSAPEVPTGFGLFPHVDPATVSAALAAGTQQGIADARSDLLALAHTDASSLLPAIPLTPLIDLPTSFATAGSDLVNNFTNAVAKVQPTVDIATALLTAVPAYDVALFRDGIEQMIGGAPVEGLVNAIGMPIAANVGLGTLLAGFEFLVLTGAWYPPPTAL